jgi:hypothetical protein
MKSWDLTDKYLKKEYKKLFKNNINILYKIYSRDYVWDYLENILFGSTRGGNVSNSKYYKTLENRTYRKKSNRELRRLMMMLDLENDIFPIYAKNIKYKYW